jgi:hypothetical protein
LSASSSQRVERGGVSATDAQRSIGRDIVVERLRQAIMRRPDLRPGSRAHWMNECEIKILQHDLVRDVPIIAGGSTRHGTVE